MEFIKKVCMGLLLAVSSTVFAEQVNINVADADGIASALKGVGASKAALVVEYRDIHGPFASVDDMALVKGIGYKTVELNRGNIIIE